MTSPGPTEKRSHADIRNRRLLSIVFISVLAVEVRNPIPSSSHPRLAFSGIVIVSSRSL